MSKVFTPPADAKITALEDGQFIARWEDRHLYVSLWYKDTPTNWTHCETSNGGPIWDSYNRDQCTGLVTHYERRMQMFK